MMPTSSNGQPPRSFARLVAICTVPPVVATTAVGLSLHGFSSLGFFVLYGLVIGFLATGFGLAVGRWSQRSARKGRG
jgi:uncharacterized membrane protein YdjX (TVP38/TMEM64 family)